MGGWSVGWVVGINENITTSAPIELGFGLGLSMAKNTNVAVYSGINVHISLYLNQIDYSLFEICLLKSLCYSVSICLLT